MMAKQRHLPVSDYLTLIMNNHPLQTSTCLSREEILQFSFGKPDDALRFRVEEHIIDCPLCAEAIEGMLKQRQMGYAQAATELESLREELTRRVRKAPTRRPWPSFNRMVAGVLLILGSLSVWMYWNHTRNERLFARYFHPVYGQYIVFRTAPDTNSGEALEEAITHYEASDFAESMVYFSDYLAENPADYKVALLAGISALEAGAHDKAVSWLESVRFNFTDLYEEATWYLALSRLRAGETEDCMELLSELKMAKDPDWSGLAAALLSELSQ